jgi:hypothetical protein
MMMVTAMSDERPSQDQLSPHIAMTVTFVSEAKRFAFAARHDNGESVYISPMLADLAGLDRKAAGRVLVATISANTDEMGSASTTPWRVLSWEPRADAAPHLVDGEVVALRNDLEEMRRTLDQLRDQLDQALHRLN